MTDEKVCPECSAVACMCGCSYVLHQEDCMLKEFAAYEAIYKYFTDQDVCGEELDRVDYIIDSFDVAGGPYQDKIYQRLTRREWHSIGLKI